MRNIPDELHTLLSNLQNILVDINYELGNKYRPSVSKISDVAEQIHNIYMFDRMTINGMEPVTDLNDEKVYLTNDVYYLTANDYQFVEYLESNGQQYIETDFTPNQDTRVDATIEFLTSSNGTVIYGASQTYNRRAFEFYSWDNKFDFNYNTYNPTFGTIVLNTKINTSQNKNEVTIEISGGATYTYTHTYGTFTAPTTMWLFALHRTNGNYFGYGGRIYELEIYDNGTKVRHFKPCYRKLDNKPGMYDTVEDKFYVNNGTGTFIVGPDVN